MLPLAHSIMVGMEPNGASLVGGVAVDKFKVNL